MNDRAIIRLAPAPRASARSIARERAPESCVLGPPADAPVLHGTPGPVRVATAEHHDPKTYS